MEIPKNRLMTGTDQLTAPGLGARGERMAGNSCPSFSATWQGSMPERRQTSPYRHHLSRAGRIGSLLSAAGALHARALRCAWSLDVSRHWLSDAAERLDPTNLAFELLRRVP